MADSDEGPPAPTSEVGSHGPRPEETRSSLEDHSATKLLSNMAALLSRMVSMSQMPSTSTTATQLLQFNPDDSDADIEGWCNVTEMIVQKKCLEGVELLMALTSALKGRAASCITRLNLNELTWPLVKQSLLAKFSKPKLPQDYFDDILRFQIGIKETASESAMRLWNMIERIPKTDMPEEVITGFVVSVLCQKDGVIRRELNAHLISNRSQLFRILGGISSKRRLESETQELEVKRPCMSDTRFPGKCYWCGLSGHQQADCRKRRDAGSTGQADASNTSRLADRTPAVTCYVCGKQGHVATACPDRKAGGGAAVKEVNLCGQRTSRGILKTLSGEPVSFLFDSGSSCSLLKESFCCKFPGTLCNSLVYLTGIGGDNVKYDTCVTFAFHMCRWTEWCRPVHAKLAGRRDALFLSSPFLYWVIERTVSSGPCLVVGRKDTLVRFTLLIYGRKDSVVRSIRDGRKDTLVRSKTCI